MFLEAWVKLGILLFTWAGWKCFPPVHGLTLGHFPHLYAYGRASNRCNCARSAIRKDDPWQQRSSSRRRPAFTSWLWKPPTTCALLASDKPVGVNISNTRNIKSTLLLIKSCYKRISYGALSHADAIGAHHVVILWWVQKQKGGRQLLRRSGVSVPLLGSCTIR